MYGTVAMLRAKPGNEAALLEEIRAEDQEAHMPGYVYQFLYRLDAQPDTYCLVVIFDSKAAYIANANSPQQHSRYLKLRALLAAEPQWHDGEMIYPPHLPAR